MLAIPKSRITAYLISCLVIVVSGSLATFSILSDGLRERFLWSFSDVNVVSAAGTASLYLSYLVAGPLYDKYGSTVTLFTGMIVYSLGYLLMYLSYNRSIGTTAILTAVYYVMCGFGSSSGYMVGIGVTSQNFPEKYLGIITGSLLLFYGLSGTLYALAYNLWFSYNTNLEGFLGFLTLSVVTIYGLGCLFVVKIPLPKQIGLLPETSAPQANEILATAPIELAITPRVASIELISVPPTEIVKNQSLMVPDTQHTRRFSSRKEFICKLIPGICNRSVNLKQEPVNHSNMVELGSLNHGTTTNNTETVPKSTEMSMLVTGEPVSITPSQMLRDKAFLLYALTIVFQQGLSYMNNVNAIIRAGSSISTNVIELQALTTRHVTLVSISQSVGRLSFGIFSDIVVHYKYDRTILLIVAEVIILLPCIILSTTSNLSYLIDSPILSICSILTGLGFGAGGGLFPTVLRSISGPKYYGTACSFSLMGVPLLIVVMNLVFGTIYDMQLANQNQSGPKSNYCYGIHCFSTTFHVSTAFQLISVCLSCALYYIRKRKRR